MKTSAVVFKAMEYQRNELLPYIIAAINSRLLTRPLFILSSKIFSFSFSLSWFPSFWVELYDHAIIVEMMQMLSCPLHCFFIQHCAEKAGVRWWNIPVVIFSHLLRTWTFLHRWKTAYRLHTSLARLPWDAFCFLLYPFFCKCLNPQISKKKEGGKTFSSPLPFTQIVSFLKRVDNNLLSG